MSQTHQQAREKHYPRYLIVLAVVLLGICYLCACITLMAFGADIALLPLLNNPTSYVYLRNRHSVISLFSASLMLWLGVKALSGFPAQAFTFLERVLHTLNMRYWRRWPGGWRRSLT